MPFVRTTFAAATSTAASRMWIGPCWPDADHRSRVVFILDGADEATVRPFFAAVTG